MASAGMIYRNYNSTDTTSQGLTISELPQPPASWEREGYFFKEWNTSRDGSGTSYQPGDGIPFSGEAYAIWYGDYIEAVKDSSGVEHPIKDIISGYITSASVPSASSTTPKMDGTAAVGTETAFARGDHVHPTDTSRASLDIVAPEWEPNVDYWEWDSVIYQGQLYFCREAHVSSSTWDSSKWTPITVGGLAYILMSEKIDDPSTKTSGQFLKYNGTTWVAGDVPEGSAASSTTPKMDGTASTGSENAFARGDHVHPTDTSRQTKITASGILKGNGSGTVTAATAGTDYQAPLTFDGTYNASTNKAATVSTVTNAINALDGGTIGTGSTTKTITSLSQSNGNVSATFNDIAFPVTSVNGQTGAVTTAEKFVITATAISGTEYYNLDKTFADIVSAIGDNKYVTITEIDATYPYTTITAQGIVFGATLLATSNNQLMAVTDGILVVQPDSGTNAMGIAVHSTNFLPTTSDIPSASSTTPSMDGTAAVGTGTTWARADHVHPTDTSRAPLASPEFTGTPTAPTATAGTNTTQIATTAFVKKAIEDALFVAEYGVTTYAEISAVLDADKPLFCYVNWNDIVCPYIGIVNNQYAFSSLGAGESTVSLYVNSSNQWSYATTNLATQSAVNAKQDALVSGTNIKTINNESILGSGNISISAGSSDVFIAEYGTTTYSEVVTASKAGKAVFAVREPSNEGYEVYALTSFAGTSSEPTYCFTQLDFGSSSVLYYITLSNTGWSPVSGVTLAPISSPTFTGTPKAPTATSGTNTTQIATTAFVQNALGDVWTLSGGTAIPSNADLDDYTTQGNYYSDLNTTARTLLNTPWGTTASNSAMAFILKVVKPTTGEGTNMYVRQELYPYKSTAKYVRYTAVDSATTVSWQPWARILTTDDQATRAQYLSNYYHDGTGGTRPTTANIPSDNRAGLRKFIATGSMTDGKPVSDGHIIHMDWDNSARWAAQIWVNNSGTLMATRGQTGASTETNGGWNDWTYMATQTWVTTQITNAIGSALTASY